MLKWMTRVSLFDCVIEKQKAVIVLGFATI